MAEKKSFDSDFCGNLPLHNVNLIQDYGYLVILDRSTFKIIQASENLAALLNNDIQNIINTDFADHVNGEGVERLRQILKKDIKDKVPLNFSLINGSDLISLVHFKPDYIILEIEKADTGTERNFTAVFQDIKYTISALEAATTVQEVCNIAIHELRRLSSFDGVLMYRFDEDWNGTVIAEEKDERLEPYIGQTFPASDVPKQARQLYLKNPYRLIPNRNYSPVRLYPVINPVTHAFLDLSDCNLRGVAGVHLEYMKNMGVTASMSIRVIRNEQLWGLISCHHITEKYLSFEICSVFELLSAVISNKVTSILNKEDFDIASNLNEKRALVVDQIYNADNIITGALNNEENNLLNLFNASGAAVVLDGRIETEGRVPEADSLDNLLLWLQGKNINKVYSTHQLSDVYDEASDYADVASGMLVIPVNRDKGDYVLLFRGEMVETINWGGDPNQAINFDKDGKNYHPRNSFKLWQQTVVQNATPWHQHELSVAETLRSFLYEYRTRQLYN